MRANTRNMRDIEQSRSVLPDGSGLLWFRILKNDVSGADMVPATLNVRAKKTCGLRFWGLDQATIDKAAAAMRDGGGSFMRATACQKRNGTTSIS